MAFRKISSLRNGIYILITSSQMVQVVVWDSVATFHTFFSVASLDFYSVKPIDRCWEIFEDNNNYIKAIAVRLIASEKNSIKQTFFVEQRTEFAERAKEWRRLRKKSINFSIGLNSLHSWGSFDWDSHRYTMVHVITIIQSLTDRLYTLLESIGIPTTGSSTIIVSI